MGIEPTDRTLARLVMRWLRWGYDGSAARDRAPVLGLVDADPDARLHSVVLERDEPDADDEDLDDDEYWDDEESSDDDEYADGPTGLTRR